MANDDELEPAGHAFKSAPRPRRARRMRRGTQGALIVIGIVLLFLLQRSLRDDVTVRVIDFSKSVERIEELSTVKSHIRFGVVVREEGGNVVVRRLADQAAAIGMDGLGNVLFQDPTMIVELHGVATYGLRLGDIAKRVRQDDSTVTIRLPAAEVLDVKLVAADTRVVAQMKGLFRSSNQTLLLDAGREGERFIMEYASRDTALLGLASERARDLLGLLVEQGGKRARFE